MYVIHTPVLQPRCKEIDVTLASFNTFNPLLGCAICLAAQAVLDILSLSPVSDAYKPFRIGTFVQDAEVPVSVFFCILLSMLALVINLSLIHI